MAHILSDDATMLCTIMANILNGVYIHVSAELKLKSFYILQKEMNLQIHKSKEKNYQRSIYEHFKQTVTKG